MACLMTSIFKVTLLFVREMNHLGRRTFYALGHFTYLVIGGPAVIRRPSLGAFRLAQKSLENHGPDKGFSAMKPDTDARPIKVPGILNVQGQTSWYTSARQSCFNLSVLINKI